MRMRRGGLMVVVAALFLVWPGAGAQILGTGPQADFKDTSMLKPPPGKAVALVVFEDLGCPACARAHPFEVRAIGQTHVPWLRYDFPIPAHVWTFQAAVDARYLEEKVSPRVAEQYRTDVFAAQASIAGKEDLQAFTARWFQAHGQTVPSAVDPSGALAKEVQADFDLGMRMGLHYTPTVVVVTPDRYQVICGVKGAANDPAQIEPVLEAAMAQSRAKLGQTARR